MTVLFLSGYEHYKRCIKITSPAAYEVWLKSHNENAPLQSVIK